MSVPGGSEASALKTVRQPPSLSCCQSEILLVTHRPIDLPCATSRPTYTTYLLHKIGLWIGKEQDQEKHFSERYLSSRGSQAAVGMVSSGEVGAKGRAVQLSPSGLA